MPAHCFYTDQRAYADLTAPFVIPFPRDSTQPETALAAYFRLGPQPRPAVVFECVGVPGILQQVLEGAPRDARIVVVGVCMERDRIEPYFAIRKQLNLQFVLGYTAEEFAATLRHLAEGAIDGSPMITGRVGLDAVKDAFTDLADPVRHAKILVEPWR